MKKYIIVFAALALAACSKKPINTEAESNVMLDEPVIKTVDSASAGKHPGLALIEGADCLTYHKEDARLV